MEFFASALKATLTIPDPFPTSTHHAHPHPTATGLPPPPHGYPGMEHLHFEHITGTGKTALWVYTTIFGLASIITFFLSKRVERKLRLFHNITGVIIVTAFLSYLAMSTGLGVSYVPSYVDNSHGHEHHVKTLREVFYARYIDWAITTPLLLLDLALLAGLPLTTTILLMLADEAMIITGLIAGLSKSGETSRWVFFAVSCGFYAYVLMTLVFSGRAAASLQSNNVQSIYLVTMGMTVILWTGYPIIFALTEGKGIVSPDIEVITYGILDVLAKVVFGMYLLIAHSHTEGDSVVISEFWTEPRSGRGYGAISQDD